LPGAGAATAALIVAARQVIQPTLAGKLIGMFVDQIISEVFADETGAARLQQVGLFTLIFVSRTKRRNFALILQRDARGKL
jgi:hypothetical protein